MKMPMRDSVSCLNSGQSYESDGCGGLRCKVCGRDGLSRTEQAMRGHLKSKRHKDSLEGK